MTSGTLAAFGPNTFHRWRTEMTGSPAVAGPEAGLSLLVLGVGGHRRPSFAARGDAHGVLIR